MLFISKTFQYILHTAGSPFRRIRLRIKRRLGWLGVPIIEPYIGVSNGREVYISGNVTEDKGLAKPRSGERSGVNMLSMFKRYVSDEISGVRVKVVFYGRTEIVETNELGLFYCYMKFPVPFSSGLRFEKVNYELLDEVVENQGPITAEGKVMVASGKVSYGVISDIDDTVMVSHSTRTLKKLRLMLFKNARTRIPFEGVTAFYRALHKGSANEPGPNPMFYVSSSEWNLYDLLIDFFEYRSIPLGPLLLKELKHNVFKFWKTGGGNHEHKFEKIRFLFSFFPTLNFVLIGDSGQHDPNIYLRIAEEFPGRVKAVYIRCVRKSHKHSETMRTANKLKALDVPVLLIDNTEEAAQHALMNGWIDDSSMIDISRQHQMDHHHTGFYLGDEEETAI
ncbi:App1 family protein [Thermophagus sp. OGC60D27]|uniref:App1 family protein n=1 Tax=Thermophagus sp. OGC60D27 TaxID=3458415 RepID=UPI004037DEED